MENDKTLVTDYKYVVGACKNFTVIDSLDQKLILASLALLTGNVLLKNNENVYILSSNVEKSGLMYGDFFCHGKILKYYVSKVYYLKEITLKSQK